MDEGLTAKLGDVRVGSILQLSHPRIAVCGYVVDRDDHTVRLSYFDPNNSQNLVVFGHTHGATRGDRRYRLEGFTQYSILAEPGTLAKRQAEGELAASIGDILLLGSEEGRVAGYLTRRLGDTISLSHVDPNAHIRDAKVFWNDFSTSGVFGAGDCSFSLKGFPMYDVLRAVREGDNPNNPRIAGVQLGR